MNRIYWTDDTDGEHYLIESADLNGQHRQEILHARHHHPFNIIKIHEQIFWIDFNEIWTLNLKNGTMPHQLAKFKGLFLFIFKFDDAHWHKISVNLFSRYEKLTRVNFYDSSRRVTLEREKWSQCMIDVSQKSFIRHFFLR